MYYIVLKQVGKQMFGCIWTSSKIFAIKLTEYDINSLVFSSTILLKTSSELIQ